MNAFTRTLFSESADPLMWTLGPLLLLAQAAALTAAWQRAHHNDRVTQAEFLADLAPAMALLGLFLAHPYMIAHPESSMPLVVAYGFLAAMYATIVYGSIGRIPWRRRSPAGHRRPRHHAR